MLHFGQTVNNNIPNDGLHALVESRQITHFNVTKHLGELALGILYDTLVILIDTSDTVNQTLGYLAIKLVAIALSAAVDQCFLV